MEKQSLQISVFDQKLIRIFQKQVMLSKVRNLSLQWQSYLLLNEEKSLLRKLY